MVSLARQAGSFLAAAQGPRVAWLEADGWDTHTQQIGRLGRQLAALDSGMAALREGLGDHWVRTTVLVMTEFGRSAAFNGSGGTDHGTGGVAFLAGGQVDGGRVLADWPGLAPGQLLEGRDLRPTLDRRSVLASLAPSGVGCHLGCYNWLVLAPRHAAARTHLLSRLPTLASILSETLMPIEARARVAQGSLAVDTDDTASASTPRPTPAGYDLRPLIERQACLTGSEFTGWLRRAIDAGQDRQIIDALAARLGVTANLVRRLWREPPRALGQPPAWLAATLVRHLDQLPERAWPQDDESWQQLIERASAAQTG
jgi:hypothetical protein